MSKYKSNKGWRNESTRHSLSRKGIKTKIKHNPDLVGAGALIGAGVGYVGSGPAGMVSGGLLGASAGLGAEVVKKTFKKKEKRKKVDYAKGMSTEDSISRILYSPKKDAVDKEILTIEVPRNKSHHLNFLKAYTKFNTKGVWKGIQDNNIQIEIEFKDAKDEHYGNELMNLFRKLNKDKIKEQVLYVRTEPVEESTL